MLVNRLLFNYRIFFFFLNAIAKNAAARLKSYDQGKYLQQSNK